jgi:hypothetical protein
MIIALFVSSCATPTDVTRPLLALKGHSMTDVIRALGAPHKEEVVAGLHVFRYQYSELHSSGAFDWTYYHDRESRWLYCLIDFIVDDKNVVSDVRIDANARGHYCPALD